jgi:proline dehydrogenase
VLRKALLAAAASERVRELVTATPAASAVVSRYVAGESIQDALDVARALRSEGLLVSLDYLGEESTDAQRAAATAAQYEHLLGRLAAEGLGDGGAVEVSVKLSALGLRLDAEGPADFPPRGPRSSRLGGRLSAWGADLRHRGRTSGTGGGPPAPGADLQSPWGPPSPLAPIPPGAPGVLGQRIAAEHLERIAVAARDAGTTATVDAEDHTATEATLRIATGLRGRFDTLGTVVQAALRRTEGDVRKLAVPGVRVRLCKGAYAEPPAEAFTVRHDIDRSFVRCLRTLMTGPGYPMIATHDPRLIAITRSLGFGRPPGSFEYQMLYGVRPDEQRRLAASGARVRVYVPYGGDWYRYLVRRLAERPANLALFLRSLGSTS